jgi:hypothetical protein
LHAKVGRLDLEQVWVDAHLTDEGLLLNMFLHDLRHIVPHEPGCEEKSGQRVKNNYRCTDNERLAPYDFLREVHGV